MRLSDNLGSEIERFLGQASKKTAAAQLSKLLEGYRLSAQSEGKSPNTIAIVAASVRYLDEFLTDNNLSANVAEIGVLQRFISGSNLGLRITDLPSRRVGISRDTR